MKRINKILAVVILMSISNFSIAEVSSNYNRISSDSSVVNYKSEKVIERIEEIQNMDLSELSRAERKALKKELKEIKKHSGLDDKFTISIGAAIIIVLLLILIL